MIRRTSTGSTVVIPMDVVPEPASVLKLKPPEGKELGPDDCPRCGLEVPESMAVLGLGRKWHDRHFVCEECALPFDEENKYCEADGKGYCEKHVPSVRVRGNCAVCTEAIYAHHDYFENMWGEMYHEEHNSGLKSCEFCGSAVCQKVESGATPVCQHCKEMAVTSRKTLEQIFDGIRVGMKEIGLDLGSQKIRLGLASQEGLNKVAGTYHQDEESTVVYPSSDVPRKERVYGILVRKNLPEEFAETRMVHEAMHIWLKLNRFPINLPPMVCEGVCQYAAYLYLTRPSAGELEEDELHRIDEIKFNADPVFGVGFNACHDAVNLVGSFHEVLEVVKKELWFPENKARKSHHEVPKFSEDNEKQNEVESVSTG